MSWRLATACWLNATMVAFFRTNSNAGDYSEQDLHRGCEMFEALCSRADRTLDLLHDEATRSLLQNWNSQGQQELLSFTGHFLGWCAPHLVITPGSAALLRLS